MVRKERIGPRYSIDAPGTISTQMAAIDPSAHPSVVGGMRQGGALDLHSQGPKVAPKVDHLPFYSHRRACPFYFGFSGCSYDCYPNGYKDGNRILMTFIRAAKLSHPKINTDDRILFLEHESMVLIDKDSHALRLKKV